MSLNGGMCMRAKLGGCMFLMKKCGGGDGGNTGVLMV